MLRALESRGMSSARIILKEGRDRSLIRRHPWIFSGSIAKLEVEPSAGETIDIFTAEGGWIARAAYSPQSNIRARVWTWERDEEIDEDFFARRINIALGARANFQEDRANSAYREIFAESDNIPGLIIDRYNDIRVVQFLTVGVERWRATIVGILEGLGDSSGIFERSDTDAREREGLAMQVGLILGSEPPNEMCIQQDTASYIVDIREGHKTGFYLDQRDNRRTISRFMGGREVLDCFCYTGSFSVAALRAGAANVVAIDSSASALALASKNVSKNSLDLERLFLQREDVFEALRSFRDQRRTFDAVILDPPRFAPTVKHVAKASRGYKDINLLALKLLRPGGILVTFSCSGGLSLELFQKIVADAALDAGVEASILTTLGQPEDHPIKLSFPESRYLKGFVVQVT